MSKIKEIRKIDYGLPEEHPFEPFILEDTEVLIVGTFPPRRFISKELSGDDVDWFYGSKDNAFWDLLGSVLDQNFSNDKESRQKQCKNLKIGFVDLFYKIGRYHENWSSDKAIHPIEIRSLSYILENYKSIRAILFTSSLTEGIAKKEYLKDNEGKLNGVEYVEGGVFRRFKQNDNDVVIRTLPSPSPSNSDTFEEKEKKWREIFSEIKFLPQKSK